MYNVLPSSYSLIQLDTSRKLVQLREFCAILLKNQFKYIFKPRRIQGIIIYTNTIMINMIIIIISLLHSITKTAMLNIALLTVQY